MSPVALHKDVYSRMSHNAYFHLPFRLDINCSGFIPFLQCSVCTVCTLQPCFRGLMDAQSPWSSGQQLTAPQPIPAARGNLCYLSGSTKTFIFDFTASFKCYLGFTFEWELTRLSLSPVSFSHDFNEVRVAPTLLWARQDKI